MELVSVGDDENSGTSSIADSKLTYTSPSTSTTFNEAATAAFTTTNSPVNSSIINRSRFYASVSGTSRKSSAASTSADEPPPLRQLSSPSRNLSTISSSSKASTAAAAAASGSGVSPAISGLASSQLRNQSPRVYNRQQSHLLKSQSQKSSMGSTSSRLSSSNSLASSISSSTSSFSTGVANSKPAATKRLSIIANSQPSTGSGVNPQGTAAAHPAPPSSSTEVPPSRRNGPTISLLNTSSRVAVPPNRAYGVSSFDRKMTPFSPSSTTAHRNMKPKMKGDT